MSIFEFVFLARKWDQDKLTIDQSMTLALIDHLPLWLILFPEGTVVCEETINWSLAYKKRRASLTHVAPPRRVLYPKVTGLRRCLDILSLKHPPSSQTLQDALSRGIPEANTLATLPSQGISYLYDVCIGYEGGGVEGGGDHAYDRYDLASVILGGLGPKRVHMRFERFKVADLPGLNESGAGGDTTIAVAAAGGSASTTDTTTNTTDTPSDPFTLWIRARFLEKEHLMERFYKEKSFLPPIHTPTTTHTAASKSETETVIKIAPTLFDLGFILVAAAAAWRILVGIMLFVSFFL